MTSLLIPPDPQTKRDIQQILGFLKLVAVGLGKESLLKFQHAVLRLLQDMRTALPSRLQPPYETTWENYPIRSFLSSQEKMNDWIEYLEKAYGHNDAAEPARTGKMIAPALVSGKIVAIPTPRKAIPNPVPSKVNPTPKGKVVPAASMLPKDPDPTSVLPKIALPASAQGKVVATPTPRKGVPAVPEKVDPSGKIAPASTSALPKVDPTSVPDRTVPTSTSALPKAMLTVSIRPKIDPDPTSASPQKIDLDPTSVSAPARVSDPASAQVKIAASTSAQDKITPAPGKIAASTSAQDKVNHGPDTVVPASTSTVRASASTKLPDTAGSSSTVGAGVTPGVRPHVAAIISSGKAQRDQTNPGNSTTNKKHRRATSTNTEPAEAPAAPSSSALRQSVLALPAMQPAPSFTADPMRRHHGQITVPAHIVSGTPAGYTEPRSTRQRNSLRRLALSSSRQKRGKTLATMV